MKLNKIIANVLLSAIISLQTKANDSTKVYNPSANAKQDVELAIKQAKQQGKQVLLMIGGNWCSWCLKFNKFITEDKQLDSAIKANYVLHHLNHSKENKNLEMLAQFDFPQRFGFPVFVILNEEGKRIHTQNSYYLEEGKGYSKEKILGFLNDWNKASLQPETYK